MVKPIKEDIKGYDVKEVSKITGITERNIRFWTDEELVIPEIETVTKRGREGKRKLYSASNIMQLMVVENLSGMISEMVTKKMFMEDLSRARKEEKDYFSPKCLSKKQIYLIIAETYRLDKMEIKPESTMGVGFTGSERFYCVDARKHFKRAISNDKIAKPKEWHYTEIVEENKIKKKKGFPIQVDMFDSFRNITIINLNALYNDIQDKL